MIGHNGIELWFGMARQQKEDVHRLLATHGNPRHAASSKVHLSGAIRIPGSGNCAEEESVVGIAHPPSSDHHQQLRSRTMQKHTIGLTNDGESLLCKDDSYMG